MPLKEKVKTALAGKNAAPSAEEPSDRMMPDDRFTRINPEIDKRLTEFMDKNPKATDHYTALVQNKPEHAVRTLMLNKMMKYESQMRVVERQLPQIKEWVAQQPGLEQRIQENIAKVEPLYQDIAYRNEAGRAKARLDFTPRVEAGVKVSM